MVDRILRVPVIPRPGQTVAADGCAVAPGGKGANQAAAAARCGGRVRMCGRTGPDGAFIVQALAERGVDVSSVRTDDALSGNACVMVAPGGENAIVIAPEANARLEANDVAQFLAAVRPGDIALFQNECAALEVGLREASRRGARTWWNAAPADAALRSFDLSALDGLVVNETEAEALTGQGDPERALAALSARMPGRTVVVTLGAAGAVACHAGTTLRMAAHAVRAVDTVGCGDAFVGAMLAALSEGRALDEALRWGNAAGALAAQREGAMPSLPGRVEVERLAGTAP